MFELVIASHIPSKKNLLRFSGTGRPYYDKDTKAYLVEIEEQVARQWRRNATTNESRTDGAVRVPREPLVHPAIAVVFYVTSDRADKDNKLATVMDALVSAGVLKDDSIAACNGIILIGKAVRSDVAGARVWLEESGDFERLWAYLRREDLSSVEAVRVAREERGRRLQRV